MKRNIILSIISAVIVIGGAVYVVTCKGGTAENPLLHAQLAEAYEKIPTATGKALFKTQSENLTKEVDPTLIDLDSQIISCSPDVDGAMGSAPMAGGSCVAGPTNLTTADGMYMGGQCCGPMKDLKAYNEELEKMQKYKDMPDMPMNPYKTPVAQAKQWIDYDKATTLSAEDQKVFDDAMVISKEKPCCCKCWHYFVNEGIGKKMIKDYHYSAQQVAEYWDTATIC